MSSSTFLDAILAFFKSLFVKPMPPEITPEVPKQPSRSEELAVYAKSRLNEHLTMDESVPWGVGCAEAISRILHDFGVSGIPTKGIPGTAGMGTFLRGNKECRKVSSPTPGCILLSETGTGNGKIRGHVGIIAPQGNLIYSNNSETGRFGAHWDIDRWIAYYSNYGGIPTQFFELI